MNETLYKNALERTSSALAPAARLHRGRSQVRRGCSADLAVPEQLRRRCTVSEKTVAQKGRVKPGTTIAVINRVPGVVESLGLPKGVAFVKPADAQLVFLFVRTRAELEARMPPAFTRRHSTLATFGRASAAASPKPAPPPICSRDAVGSWRR